MPSPEGSKKDYAFKSSRRRRRTQGKRHGRQAPKNLGRRLEKLSPEQLGDIVDDLLEYEKPDALAVRLAKRYGIAPAKAEALADVTLEDGYASFSREAMQKLLPLMESGRVSPASRENELEATVSQQDKGGTMCELLPPVLEPCRNCEIRSSAAA